MTTSEIKTIEDMACAEGMKTLQLTTKSGRILYDSIWIAGVDFTEQDDDQGSYHYADNNEEEEEEEETQDDINPNEIAEILDDNPIQARKPNDNDNNPMDSETENDTNDNDDEEEEDVPETLPPTVRRTARTAKPGEKYKNYTGGNINQNERMDTSDIANENQFVVALSCSKSLYKL